MKILLLTDVNSSHSRKWALGLAAKGSEIGIFSISSPVEDWYTAGGVRIFAPVQFNRSVFSSGIILKARYLRLGEHLKKVINSFSPDIIHAHYASSYGLLGALSGFHPFIISVWGTDVYDFPRRTLLNRAILKFNLGRSDRILSTSRTMAAEIRKYSKKEIIVTPFGIDTSLFKPEENDRRQEQEVVIGTIKSLEVTYGIEYLLRAFSLVYSRSKGVKLRLLIVGSGSLTDKLKELAVNLGIEAITEFTGSVSYNEIVSYHNKLDIYVAVSVKSESFGVAVLEASACGKPVIVSNVGGLPEVVKDGITGIVVPPADPKTTATAIEKLVMDPSLRRELGENGRRHVKMNYEWSRCIDQMIEIYSQLNIRS